MQATRCEQIVDLLTPHKARLLMTPYRNRCAGGDGVEVVSQDKRTLLFFHDVVGHGTKAAYYSSYMSWMFRHVMEGRSIDAGAIPEIVSDFNELCCAIQSLHVDRNTQAFTVCGHMVLIDSANHSLHACVMGDTIGYFRTKNTLEEVVPTDRESPMSERTHTLFLGVEQAEIQDTIVHAYTPGDKLILFSDGMYHSDHQSLADKSLVHEAMTSDDPFTNLCGVAKKWNSQWDDDVTILEVELC